MISLERDLPARYDQMGVEVRERIKWDIREAIVGAENFLPKHAMIATWKNVSFVGGYNALENVGTHLFYIIQLFNKILIAFILFKKKSFFFLFHSIDKHLPGCDSN